MVDWSFLLANLVYCSLIPDQPTDRSTVVRFFSMSSFDFVPTKHYLSWDVDMQLTMNNRVQSSYMYACMQVCATRRLFPFYPLRHLPLGITISTQLCANSSTNVGFLFFSEHWATLNHQSSLAICETPSPTSTTTTTNQATTKICSSILFFFLFHLNSKQLQC